ncbi:MAG: polysaccharide deacetylase family protein [Acidimicrobiales bacterium]|nr:polysaccharide deacetylase family protein [Acidimicrobiales bacterium]
MPQSGAAITFTLDLEDHRPSADVPARFPDVTRRLLDHLDHLGVRATVFVVGEVAQEQPRLVRDVAARGHELGLHGWRHVPLTTLDPAELRADAARGRALLEDLAGRPVLGFRAPTFSLVPGSRWAPDVLREVGFTYSSSVLAARNPLFGWPGAPRVPFTWPSGLVELPCPLLRAGPLAVPFLGGVYLRVLPWAVVRAGLASGSAGPTPWIYCHPYDFDAGEPYWVVPDAGRLGSRLLWLNRRGMLTRVERLLAGRAGPPLGERVGSAAAPQTAFGPQERP